MLAAPIIALALPAINGNATSARLDEESTYKDKEKEESPYKGGLIMQGCMWNVCFGWGVVN